MSDSQGSGSLFPRVPIDVFPDSEVVRFPARRAQPAAHTTRVWTGPAGCPVAPSSPRLCLRPDAACGLAEDSLKRRRRQEVKKTKQPTASSLDTVVRLVPPVFSWCLNIYAGLRDGGFRERFAQTCRSKCGHVPERCQTEPTEPQRVCTAGVAAQKPRSQVFALPLTRSRP